MSLPVFDFMCNDTIYTEPVQNLSSGQLIRLEAISEDIF